MHDWASMKSKDMHDCAYLSCIRKRNHCDMLYTAYTCKAQTKEKSPDKCCSMHLVACHWNCCWPRSTKSTAMQATAFQNNLLSAWVFDTCSLCHAYVRHQKHSLVLPWVTCTRFCFDSAENLAWWKQVVARLSQQHLCKHFEPKSMCAPERCSLLLPKLPLMKAILAYRAQFQKHRAWWVPRLIARTQQNPSFQ